MDGRDKPGHDGWASIYFRHCHGKLRQIKLEQLGRSAKPYCRAIVPGFSSRSSMALKPGRFFCFGAASD
jgi:hypothetical protein